MNFIKPFLISILLLTATVYSQSWVVQPTNITPPIGDIKQIHAINANIVYALTLSEILKTTNGGTTWGVIRTTSVGTGTSFNGFQWNNADEGYVWYYAGNKYIKTIDGGLSWTEITDLPGNTGYMQFSVVNNLLNVNYINSGYSGTRLWYTTNSGLNWYFNNASFGNMNAMGTMHFINEQTGFVNGGSSFTYYHVLLKTINRGFTWTPVKSSAEGYNSGGDFQFFGNVGYHVSNNTYRTDNLGTTWDEINAQGGGPYALFMHTVQRGWLGKQNGLLKTTDGCTTWVNQNIVITGIDINSVSFIGWSTGWIAGESGYILKTTNGGGVIAPANQQQQSGPANGSSGHHPDSVKARWNARSLTLSGIEDSTWYGIQLSTDSTFTTTVINTDTVTLTQYQVPAGILNHDVRYFWRVRAINIGGEGPWSPVWNFRTGLVGLNQTGNEIPVQHKLYNNYPNPFNPVTKIKFDIPQQSFTKLTIYDIGGKEVSVLVNRELNPGSYEAEFNASNLPSGVYFYKLSSGGYTDVKKMILVK